METCLSIIAMILVISASMLVGVEIAYRVQKTPLPRWVNIWLAIQSVAIVSLLVVRVWLYVFS